ncbi:hydrogenase formation protein HypD [Aneurinibacillus terranovensis]|uniref:hydrogenase formation protein HypD n=1 Tax=Aneurinibacillus terranovensis TaxID=278991 RepID=UPI001FE0E035|nr:hydrogenase formation protein HypD [Aneurinibacillus terranovensis]
MSIGGVIMTMKYVDEFRDPELIRRTSEEIHRLVDPDYHYRFMEVCGGHTFSIFRFGLQHLLPANIELVHGPGCPVCVLPMGRMDDGLSIARQPNVIFTAFGDVMRVPGSQGTPLELRARGTDIRMIYSPLDALKIAMDHPEQQVVLFAIGFETTAPSTALTLMRARELNVPNFYVFSNHVMILPAIRTILDSPDMRIDGFIGPGHVSTVIGAHPYELVTEHYGKPVVISGFEPLDLLQSILMLVKQMKEGRAQVENQYSRVVPWEGNIPALEVMNEVFEVRPFFEWRGLGVISQSALKLRPEFARWDAEVRFQMEGVRVTDPKAAQCGEVLKGVLKPHQCKWFGKECTPEHPIGALMVSSEGACAAYYHHVHMRQAIGE